MNLFNLIAWVETRGNFKSFRFEPATYAKLLLFRTDSQKLIIQKIVDCNGGASGCSWHTALIIYSSSWGAVQIMGFNLYGPVCNYMGNVSDFLQNVSVKSDGATVVFSNQETAFNRFILSLKLDGATPENLASHAALRRAFALEYNGSPDYMSCISEALTANNFKITG